MSKIEAGYLVAEEGPLAGTIIPLQEGEEWTIGRDPDTCFFVLEDPMVSRKHLLVSRSEDGLLVENLSATNPALLNGVPLEEARTLQEGDLLQIGTSFFHFTTKNQHESESELPIEEELTIFEEATGLDAFSFTQDPSARFILKVTSGPNAGAEYSLSPHSSHILGKDASVADVVFHDLSVSRKHAKIDIDEQSAIITDLGSRNGTYINGSTIHDPYVLKGGDMVQLGTTQLILVDREASQDTIVTPAPEFEFEHEEGLSEEALFTQPPTQGEKRSWKETFIPYKHLIVGGVFASVALLGFTGLLTLFSSEAVSTVSINYQKVLCETLEKYPAITFTYNEASKKIFVVGHVISEVDHEKVIFLLKNLPFIATIEDSIVIDELVWQNFNAMLMKYPDWRGVSLTSSSPGQFLLRGYIANPEQLANLMDWVHLNFPYTDKLTNGVAAESTMQLEVQNILMQDGLYTLQFQIANGVVNIAGRIPSNGQRSLENAITSIRKVRGVSEVKNYVLSSGHSASFIDISSQYQVTGTSKIGSLNTFVVIGGKILSKGDSLDGMVISDIENSAVILEKDGVKYRIQYNQQ